MIRLTASNWNQTVPVKRGAAGTGLASGGDEIRYRPPQDASTGDTGSCALFDSAQASSGAARLQQKRPAAENFAQMLGEASGRCPTKAGTRQERRS